MELIIKIAWRNIQRHRGKSFVIGIILFLGALIMTIGNGVISGMDKGLRENIMNRFTGQIVVISDKQAQDNVIFTPMGKDVEVITGYEKIKKILESQDYIARFLPAAKGVTMIMNQEGDVGVGLVLGVKFEDYQKMFLNNVKLVEGTYLKNDDRGILITTGSRKKIYDEQDFWPMPEGVAIDKKNLTPEALKNRNTLDIRNNIVLMGLSSENTTMDIRIDVKGIVKYEYLDDFWSNFNLMDIESFREIFQYVTASDAAVQIPKEKKKILESDNLDSLFGDTVVEKTDAGGKNYDVSKLIGKMVVRKKISVDSGAYNLIFVKLKDIDSIEKSLVKLTRAFKAAGAEARAVSWKDAVGQIADMAMIMRGATTGFVMLIFIVAIIIIMNTLSMAALERVSEIGMMRAVGSQKSFIAGMFFAETAIISFVFGGVGIVMGIAVVYILNLFQITTDNHILELLFGGNIFRPSLGFMDIMIGVTELAMVTVIATLYPLKVARRITPLDAISRD
jgi:ABC-type lipoprotein release transport system permease subunit